MDEEIIEVARGHEYRGPGYCMRCGYAEDLHDGRDSIERQPWSEYLLNQPTPPAGYVNPLPLHRTEANYGVRCGTCDGGGCHDCTDPA